MPKRENERALNEDDDNLKYDPILKRWLKRCEHGHGWFTLDYGCPKCKPAPIKNKSTSTPSDSNNLTGQEKAKLTELAKIFENKPSKEGPQIAKPFETASQIKGTDAPSKPEHLEKCPKCGKYSLKLNPETNIFTCLNTECNFIFYNAKSEETQAPSMDWRQKQSREKPGNFSAPIPRSSTSSEQKSGRKTGRTNKNGNTTNHPVPSWLISLLLIFALSIIGVAFSTYAGTFIPFWMIFGFSCIFSIDKWFRYPTMKNKGIGKAYRLFLNLCILSLFGLLIWTGTKLFSQQLFYNSLVGSLIFIGEFILFIWIWRVVSRNSWRWPSMKLTLFSLICLFLVFSFAGVQPMSSYKDAALSKTQTFFSDANRSSLSQQTTASTENPNPPTTIPYTAKPTVSPGITSVPKPTITQTISSPNGIYKNYFLGLVNSPEGNISSNGCYDDTGKFVILINNKNAKDPTYSQLTSFLQNNKTDQYPYQYIVPALGSYYGTAESHVDIKNIQNIIDGINRPSNPKICADFAERLHNDAEMAGLHCAYVSLDMTGYTDPAHLGISPNAGHACNAFQTTDRGLIYVDCTGMLATEPHPVRMVSTVNVQIGKPYIPVSVFPEKGWQSASENMGTVTGIFTAWDGKWSN